MIRYLSYLIKVWNSIPDLNMESQLKISLLSKKWINWVEEELHLAAVPKKYQL